MNLKSHWDELIKLWAELEIEDHFKVAAMAQFILESGRGTSRLSYQCLNFAGLKWRKEMKGIAVPFSIKVPSEKEPVEFCKFDSVANFVVGYWTFINRSPYKGWENCKTSLEYIEHLQKAGYAADAGYIKKVSSLFNEARKLLNEHGSEIGDERPDEPIGLKPYEIPEFKTLPSDIRFDNQGNYRTPTGYASGLVVHFTVSGRTEKSAQGVARYMASKGLGCLVMDENGVIWVPKDWDWRKQWDDHAGVSSWRGMSSVSKYFMGMEICCWGNGAKGKGLYDVVTMTKQHHNQQPGTYQRYTKAQEKSLINFVLWQLDTNPEFKLDNVCGHDECAPTRKPDPGYSLSMSMPEFRKMIEEKL